MEFNYSHVQIVIILVSLVLGYVVWTYNSKSYLNRILTLIIISVLLIEISHFIALRRSNNRFIYAAVVLGSLGISFFTPLFYTLSLYYPIKKDFKIGTLYVVYGLAILFSALIALSFPKSYIINQVNFPVNLKNVTLYNLPLFFVSLYFCLTSFSLILLVIATRNLLCCFQTKVIPYERWTVHLLVVVGAPIAFLLSVVSVINYFFNIPFPWIGFFFGAFTFFVVILIFRFHLVDFKRFVYGIIFYPALIAILVFIYNIFIFQNQHKIAQVLILPESVVFVLEVFIIYLVVTTITRLLRINLSWRRFFGTSMSGISSTESLEYLSYAKTLKELANRLKELFHRMSSIDNLYLLHFDDQSEDYIDVENNPHGVKIPASDEMIRALVRLKRGVALEELLIHVNNRTYIKKLYDLGINLVLPILRENKIIALLLLPNPGFLRRWSYDDINSLNFLKIIVPSLIGRCLMYETEREIEKHQYRMEQLMVIGEMSSGIAHEIRNPLSIISTSVETILNGDISEKEKKLMLQYIQEESNRINILANKLLSINFSKKPEFSRVDFVKILGKLKKFLEFKLRDSKIQLEISGRNAVFIYSDENIIFQIFLNLVLNSMEAIGKSGQISIEYEEKGSVIEISVVDTGPGIPASLKTKIFEPFFTTKKKGSGLGLTVTKQLVERLFGSIELLDTKKGSCFKIKFPLLPMGE